MMTALPNRPPMARPPMAPVKPTLPGEPTNPSPAVAGLPPVPESIIQKAQEPIDNRQFIASLGLFIRQQFERAKNERIASGIEESMVRAKYARALQYDPTKLAQIQAMFDASYEPPYMPVIETKCRALEDWLMDVYFQAGQRPFDIQNTPEPTVSDEVRSVVRMQYSSQIAGPLFAAAEQQFVETGQAIDFDGIASEVELQIEQKSKLIEAEVRRVAKEMTAQFSVTVDDKLVEGGWYQALREVIHDIATFPAGFVAGPEERMVVRRKRVYDPGMRRQITYYPEEPTSKFRRVSPVNMYPLVGARTCNDGIIERTQYSPMELQSMIGIDGFNDAEIRAVLSEAESGSLREWTTIDSRIANLDNRSNSTLYMGDNIDALIYWGQAPGKLLIEWGMNAKRQIVTDPTKWYRIYAIHIGNHTIMARLNPNPDGKVNYFKASFVQDPDKFWNLSVPDILWPHQTVCNAVIRACQHNVGLASGPIIEQDVDRIPDRGPLHALKRFYSTGSQMAAGRAMNFYNVQLLTGPMQAFYDFMLTLADLDSGIPRMAHGGGGPAGGITDTASGTSMFLSTSARGVKAVIEHIDRSITEPSVEAQAYFILDKDDNLKSPPGELKIVAKGSSVLIAKEQETIRMRELLRETNNPTDISIIGPEGRRHMLRDVMKSLPMDLEKILPEEQEQIYSMTGEVQPQAGGGQDTEALTPSGNRSGGRDFTLFPAEGNA